ncbi:MAG: tetratricopeptide repeat protein [Oligoflexia bacterium]|nr:tetratricopeptide repeat protein [Oligoflexia bacterium]
MSDKPGFFDSTSISTSTSTSTSSLQTAETSNTNTVKRQGPKELQLMAEGEGLYQKHSYLKAEKVFLEILEINPQNIEALFLLGNIYYNTGKIDKGIKAFRKLLELDSFHTEAAICLSVLYNDIGRYQEAKAIFNEINQRVKTRNGNSSTMGGAAIAAATGVYGVSSWTPPAAQAQTTSSDTTIETETPIQTPLHQHLSPLNDPYINKKFAFKHYELGDLYFTYDRYDEALFEYSKASRLDPTNLEARIQIAKVYSKKGYVAKATEELKKIRNEYPNFTPARIALGILYYGGGQVVEAQSEWQRVLSKDPQNKEALMYLQLSSAATETRI